MKSRPVYAGLELDTTARRHLFLTQGQSGLNAAQRLLAAASQTNAALVTLDDPATRETLLFEVLARAGMDTAFYLAGPELFLWQTSNRLRSDGVENRRIRMEIAGSTARRVYCVVCGTMNEGVTTAMHRCESCGLELTVRDHFSRPLEAYMGVIADLDMIADLGAAAP